MNEKKENKEVKLLSDLQKLEVLSSIIHELKISEEIYVGSTNREVFVSTEFKDLLLNLKNKNLFDLKEVLKKINILKTIDNVEIIKGGFILYEGKNKITLPFSNIEAKNDVYETEENSGNFISVKQIMNQIELSEIQFSIEIKKEQLSTLLNAMKQFEIKNKIIFNIQNGEIFVEVFSKSNSSSFSFFLCEIEDKNISRRVGIKLPIYTDNWNFSFFKAPIIKINNDDFTFITTGVEVTDNDILKKIIEGD